MRGSVIPGHCLSVVTRGWHTMLYKSIFVILNTFMRQYFRLYIFILSISLIGMFKAMDFPLISALKIRYAVFALLFLKEWFFVLICMYPFT